MRRRRPEAESQRGTGRGVSEGHRGQWGHRPGASKATTLHCIRHAVHCIGCQGTVGISKHCVLPCIFDQSIYVVFLPQKCCRIKCCAVISMHFDWLHGASHPLTPDPIRLLAGNEPEIIIIIIAIIILLFVGNQPESHDHHHHHRRQHIQHPKS